MRDFQKITIVCSEKPTTSNINSKLQWFGTSLGLFTLRDKDKSYYRIFIELIKGAKHKKRMTSDELAEQLHLSRGTVVHHLNKLIDAGIAVPLKNTYILRVDKLTELVDVLEKDILESLKDIRSIAEELDSWLGL
ncbi:MAG: winged helix-turn-helix domain-containing protein [Candidatus Woesearchaeota archaeon]